MFDPNWVLAQLNDEHLGNLDAVRWVCDSVPQRVTFQMKEWRMREPIRTLVDLRCLEWGCKGPFHKPMVNTRISDLGRQVLALVPDEKLRAIEQAAYEAYQAEYVE